MGSVIETDYEVAAVGLGNGGLEIDGIVRDALGRAEGKRRNAGGNSKSGRAVEADGGNGESSATYVRDGQYFGAGRDSHICIRKYKRTGSGSNVSRLRERRQGCEPE